MTADRQREDPRPDNRRPDDAWRTPHDLVLLTAPTTPEGYYRLRWTTPGGGRGQTTGGRTFEGAWQKALTREADLLRGATPKTEKPIRDGIAYWLDPERPTPRGGWGPSHRHHMNAYARVYFLPTFGRERCMDLRRSHIQQCVNAAPTASEGRNIRRAAASLIGALRQGDFLLDNQVLDLSNVFWHGVQQGGPVSTSGEAREFVSTWSRPSNDQVRRLRLAAEQTGRIERSRWWRGLMVEVAAYAGPRWSELIALTAESVDPDRRTLKVHWRVSQHSGAPRQLAAPKMAKRRTTIYPEVSPTGYDLGAAMTRRLEEVHRERYAGHNRRGLLFPSPFGDWWWTGVFHRDFFEKSALAAGWHFTDELRPNAGTTRLERRWELTWHSLRHTFCTTALEDWGLADSTVSMLAGHSDPNFTRTRYVGAAEDSVDAAIAATSAATLSTADQQPS